MLVIKGLSKSFRNGIFSSPMSAVKNVSFSINEGEAFGLMGSSGSGKSTIARLILRLINADKGKVFFRGKELLSLSKKEYAPYRKRIQIIFQQPIQALDPKQTIFNAIAEPLLVHNLVSSGRAARKKVEHLLEVTHLSHEILDRYPHQISGGQAQRVVIARALGVNPFLIVADEPTSMLDISAQAQILALLKKLQIEQGIGILLISHDVSVIRHFCSRLAVIEKGEIVCQTDSSTYLN
ncbi:dipeptide/oligopeptide/nickel ABC transporter ATP-binding protein [bacterium]|nr:dipeptide/oligopeptide/nickel ABC transporter ATP-binding protein [bacterium]